MNDKVKTLTAILRDGTRAVGILSAEIFSDDESKISYEGVRDFYNKSSPITRSTIFGIGSVTKQFTAATLLKLWDNELQNENKEKQIWFENGIDTKLSKFMQSLKQRHPNCIEIFEKFENDPSYNQIRLRDLLNHTHGLGSRNLKGARDLVRKADGKPIELQDIVNITQKRPNEEYGRAKYGNLGYDLCAMIIEVISNLSYDDAVKDLVLKPYLLSKTYTQSDNVALHEAREKLEIATSYAFDLFDPNPETGLKYAGEIKTNINSTSRAASGMKSTIDDLAKFAKLFIGAEMFESEVVKIAIKDRADAVSWINQPPSYYYQPASYHLGIGAEADGNLGHEGHDFIFFTQLLYDAESHHTKIRLEVAENLTDYMAKKIFSNIYGREEADKINSSTLWEKYTIYSKLESVGRPYQGTEDWNSVMEEVLLNNELSDLIEKYNEIRQRLSNFSAQDLIEKREEIIDELSRDLMQEPRSSAANPKVEENVKNQNKQVFT